MLALLFSLFGALAAPVPTLEQLDVLLDAEDRRVRDALLVGTPDERRAIIAPLAATTSKVVSLHLKTASTDPRWAALALRTLLRRKGQLVDAEYATREIVRETADDEGQQRLDALLLATEQLDQLLARKNPPRREVKALRGRVAELQKRLALKSRPYRAIASLIEPSDIASTLDSRMLLVEFVVYRPWDAKSDTYGEERYAVYTLERGGSIHGVDVGPAKAIDEAVRRFRGAMTALRDVAPLADDLRARIFGDVPWVTRAPRVIISPDGLLAHVPFQLVIGRASDDVWNLPRIAYLTSGRERPFLGAWDAETTNPLAVFDIDYGTGRPWGRLPGTVAEGESIAAAFPDTQVLRGAEATEAAVAKVSRPQFLHIASHGFFEANLEPTLQRSFTSDDRGLGRPKNGNAPVEPLATGVTDIADLRSGVVFAGANLEGNVTTAAEWSNRDLRGTRLVVLSACETGLGEIRNGDGVHGLRRALVLAGTQTQVLSLWKVDDKATQVLMTEFYAQLAKGKGASESLFEAQRAVRTTEGFGHPFYWAAFTLSGRPAVTLVSEEEASEAEGDAE
ncbi:MAG: CHAT domain-containing protein [Myxococcota bacterium]